MSPSLLLVSRLRRVRRRPCDMSRGRPQLRLQIERKEVAMRTMSALVSILALLGAMALVPVIGAVLFSAVLFGGAVLALVGVFSGVEDRTVEQRDPVLDPVRWRRGL